MPSYAEATAKRPQDTVLENPAAASSVKEEALGDDTFEDESNDAWGEDWPASSWKPSDTPGSEQAQRKK